MSKKIKVPENELFFVGIVSHTGGVTVQANASYRSESNALSAANSAYSDGDIEDSDEYVIIYKATPVKMLKKELVITDLGKPIVEQVNLEVTRSIKIAK